MRNLGKFLIPLLLIPQVCFGAASRDFVPANNTVIDFGSAASIDNAGSTAASFGVWLCPDVEADGIMATKRTGTDWADGVWGISTTSGATQDVVLYRRTSGGTLQSYAATGTMDTGVWAWYVITYAGNSTYTNSKLYENNTQLSYSGSSQNGGSVLSDASHSLYAGSTSNNGAELDGRMAYFHFAVGKTWSAVEMEELRWKPGMIPESLDVFATFWGDSTEPDLSGSGNTGAVTNGATSTDGPPVMFGGGLPL